MTCNHDFPTRGNLAQTNCIACIVAERDRIRDRLDALETDLRMLCDQIDGKKRMTALLDRSRALIAETQRQLDATGRPEDQARYEMLGEALLALGALGV